jgi:hypothetical protein
MYCKVAVMQPYIFPYVGYMNLVSASDVFVFYDDVNFIKKGWVHRNRIILSEKMYRFTIPLKNASQNRLIKDTQVENLNAFSKKFLLQLNSSYKGAKFYKKTMDYIENVLESNTESIGCLAADSVIKFFSHIGVKKNFIKSSEMLSCTKGLGKAERLIRITQALGSSLYINPIAGNELYSTAHFEKSGVKISFVKPKLKSYVQVNSSNFIPSLSIIDLMMNLSVDELTEHMTSFDFL